MPFKMTQASPDDASNLSSIFFEAFSDPFNKTMFPPTPDVRAWLVQHLFGGKGQQKKEVFLKVTDESNPDAPVAFAKWIRPVDAADPHGWESDAPRWPVSSDPELCERFFGLMEEHHHRLMGDRPHYYLELLAVHPSFQGQGLASMLLKWGLSRADEEDVEVFLTSSPDGRRLYERNGFEVKDSFSPFPGYEYWSMIRPVQL